MTRENKLALIVGFSIILVVGVLVSDHFSKARQARLTEVEEAPTSVAGELVDPLAREEDPAPSVTRERTARAERPRTSSGGGLIGETLRTRPSEDDAVALDDPDPLGATGDPLDSGGEPIVIHQGTPEPETLALNEDSFLRLMRRAREEGVELQPLLTPSRAAPERREGSHAGAAAQPEHAEYVVQKNDSLYALAERFLGSGEKWRELRELNKDRLPNGEVLRIGMKLRVPASGKAGASAAPQRSNTGSEPRGSSDLAREYEVKSGDTLGEIAQRECGSAKRVNEILELNSDKIDDADEIYVGMTLRLPSR